ncbi:hypothetical protein MMC15_000920, partial [Xylographa vitiligo]|nr:hypothetical protein [Xylographa vitiligo]
AKLERSGKDFGGWQVTKIKPPFQDSKAKKVVGNIVDKFRTGEDQEVVETRPLLGSRQQPKLNKKKSIKNLFRRKTEEEPEPVPSSSQRSQLKTKRSLVNLLRSKNEEESEPVPGPSQLAPRPKKR